MSHRLYLARHPQYLDAPHALVIADMIELARLGQRTCLRAVVEMCTDLHQHGTDSRYIKPLGGPLYELKKKARDGGPRVYFLRRKDGFVLVHAECKNEDRADQNMLKDALLILEAIEGEIPVLDASGRKQK